MPMVGMGAHALEKVVSSRDGRKKSILQMFQLSLRAESDARKFRKARAVAEIERQLRLRWVGGRGLAKVPA